MPVQTRAMTSNASKSKSKSKSYKSKAYKSSLDDFATVFSHDIPYISSDFARINNPKTPKLKNPRTDKNNKNKKRKKQQTLDRKVDTDLKEIQAEVPEVQEVPVPAEIPVETLEQIAQISYLGNLYSLFWDYSKNKAIMDTSDGYVEYDDMPIIDIIYRHFDVCNIVCEYPGSDEALHTLVSCLPLAQYTLLPNGYSILSNGYDTLPKDYTL